MHSVAKQLLLSRLPRRLLDIKSRLIVTKINSVCAPTSSSSIQLRLYSSDYKSEESSKTNNHRFFMRMVRSCSLLLAGFGLGIALNKSNSFDEDVLKKWFFWLPSVRAALPTDLPGGSDGKGSRRHNFNFIADVVTICGPSVVYIEIIDPRFNRCG